MKRKREEEIEKAVEEEFEDHLFEDESDYIMQSSKFKKGIKWSDEHPREGLWDANKVLAWISQNIESYCKLDAKNFNNLLFDLGKAMEE